MPRFLAGWTSRRFAAVWILLSVGAVCAGRAIQANDRRFIGKVDCEAWRNSAILEWLSKPREAEDVVTEWRRQKVMDVAYRGLLLDTLALIPLYSTAIAAVCFWAAFVSAPGSRLRGILLALAWCGWIAGGLDLIENSGIFVEERFSWYVVALPTACIALLKWTLAVLAGLAGLGRLLLWFAARR